MTAKRLSTALAHSVDTDDPWESHEQLLVAVTKRGPCSTPDLPSRLFTIPWQVRTRILNSFSGLPDCSVGGPVGDFFERTLAQFAANSALRRQVMRLGVICRGMGRTHFCLVPRGSSAGVHRLLTLGSCRICHDLTTQCL